MDGIQKKIIALFTSLMPEEMVLTTSIKGLSLFRIDRSFPRTPISYNSEIIILGQGKKRVYLGNDVYPYDFSRFLVLPVPLPTECEGRTESGKPIMGLTITIDPIEVGEILLGMEDSVKETQSLPKGIYDAPMNEALYDATIRLLKAIADPQDKMLLAPMIKREIIYRILQGEKGAMIIKVNVPKDMKICFIVGSYIILKTLLPKSVNKIMAKRSVFG